MKYSTNLAAISTLCAFLNLSNLPIAAQTPNLEITTPSGHSLVSTAEFNRLTEQLAQYQAAVTELEESYPVNSEELYLSLAAAHVALGDAEKASEAYNESLQAIRVNYGLYAEQQLAVLEAHNSILFDLGDWEQIDSNFHLARHIASKVYGVVDSRYIAIATELASWKIKAFDAGLYRADDERSVEEAARIYRVLIDGVSADDPEYRSKLVDYHQAKGLAHFYSAKYIANLPIDAFRANAPDSTARQECYSLVMSVDSRQPVRTACQGAQSDPEFFAAQQRAKNETVRRHLASMRESFTNAISIIEDDSSASPREVASAILNLGDASFLAQDFPRANSQYRKAWDLLSQDGGLHALRNELMGTPTRVMQDVLQDIVIDERVRADALSGTVTFDVTARGEIENIDIQGVAEAVAGENIAAIAIRLDQATYRPRIEQGRPVTASITLQASDI